MTTKGLRKKKPPSPARVGRKVEVIRWTIDRAANEFDIDRATLSKRLKAASIEPGEDGMFGTMQICAAKFTDKDIADARDKNAAADLKELKLKQQRRELVPRAQVEQDLTARIVEARQAVWNHPELTEEMKRELLANMAERFECGRSVDDMD